MYRQYFMRVSLSNSTHNTLETAAFNGKILKFQVEIDAFPLHIKLDMFTFKWQEIFLHGDRGCVKLFAIFFSSQFSNFQVYKILFYFIATRSLAPYAYIRVACNVDNAVHIQHEQTTNLIINAICMEYNAGYLVTASDRK